MIKSKEAADSMLKLCRVIVGSALCAGILARCEAPVRADRIVLAPTGTTLSESSIKSDILAGPYRSDYSWVTVSSADGIEVELSHFQSKKDYKQRWGVNLEYPLPTLNNLPAISVGVQDILGTAREHGAFYLAASQKIPLSSVQKHLFKRLTLTAGLGSGTIGGAFVGAEASLQHRVFLDAEVYHRRLNFGAGFVTLKNLRVKAECVGGSMYYGASYHFTLK
jgi:Exopolysaccharide biosynthesis protein YbjH